MPNKNILFLIDSLKSLGGAEQMFIDQANYFYEKGINVFFALTHSNPRPDDFSKELHIGRDVKYFMFKNIFDLKSHFLLASFIKKNKIGVVYSYLDFSNMISRLNKLFYTLVKVCIVEPGAPERKTSKMRFLDWFLNFFVHKVFAMSEAVKDSLVAYLKIHSHKILAMRNGVHAMANEQELEKIIKNRDDGVINLLHVGNMMNENKGHVGMIMVAKKLSDDHPDLSFRLIFVGNGILRNDLEKMVKESNLADKVIFVGAVPHAKIKEYYSSADIFIFNSRTEGGAASIMEACSAALPVVSCNFASASEVVENNESGFLVPLDDIDAFAVAVLKLCKNKELRVKMGKYGYYKLYKEKFDYERQADKFIEELWPDLTKEEKMNYDSYSTTIELSLYNTAKLKEVEREVFEKWLPKERKKILDLGCGVGRTTINLHQMGHEVMGVDLVPEMISLAKERHPQIDFRIMNACELDFPKESFDAVLFSFNGLDCIYPESKRFKAVGEISRVLKPGGLFIFSSHNSIVWPTNKYLLFWWFLNIITGRIFTAYRLEYKQFRQNIKFVYYARRPGRQIKDIEKYDFKFLDIFANRHKTKNLFFLTLFEPWPYYVFRKK